MSTNFFKKLTPGDAIYIMVLIVGLTSTIAVGQYQINDLRSDIKETQNDHDVLIEIRSDVEWIKKALEHK